MSDRAPHTITLGLIDTLKHVAQALRERDLRDPEVLAALDDLRNDADVRSLIV